MIIAVDFDGTCVTHEFPEVGKDIGAVPVLQALVKNEHKLILWTMRSNNGELDLIVPDGIEKTNGNFLDDAVRWFSDNQIELWGIQSNPEQSGWTTSPKAYAQLYIDDAALGCPLTYPLDCKRPHADWGKIRELLIEKEIL